MSASPSASRPAPAPTRPPALPRAALAAHTAVVFLFLYVPIAILVVFSFNQGRRAAMWQGFSAEQYGKILRDFAEGGPIRHSVSNSLKVASVTTLVALAIGLPAGMALARGPFRGRTLTQAMLLLPLVIPEIVLGVAMATFFGAVGMPLSLLTVVIAHVVFSVSYVAIVIRARAAGVDPALAEAAADLGAPPLHAFVRVTLPQLMPGIVAAALLVFTISLDDYLITSLVAGVGSTTLPVRIYSMLKVGVSPEVNAISTLLLVFTTLLILLAQWLLAGAAPKKGLTR